MFTLYIYICMYIYMIHMVFLTLYTTHTCTLRSHLSVISPLHTYQPFDSKGGGGERGVLGGRGGGDLV